ncbi:MAG: glycoside hydrolase family 97 N-terminal domain-containing protein, partial [Flavobacteriaceae bacterium]
MNRFYPLILVLALVLNSCTKPSETYDLIAPNGIQKMIFSIENGQPQYSLSSGEKVILGDSKLGLEFKKLGSWNQGFEVTNTELRSFDETWEQVWGQFKEVRNHYNELELNLTQKNTGYQLNLYFRMFDDGLAFRYEIPAQEGVEAFTITKENTEFNFTQDETAWWIPVHSENSYYESIYRETPISQTDTLNTPATFELKNGKVASIHEANLTDYASMTLLHKKGFGLESYLVPWANGDKVYGSAPFETPWRMVLVGDQVGDLAESNTMLNLNAPLAISTDWIHPSKYIGIWWGMHVGKYTWGSGDRHGANNKVVKEYIDFASENGFDGVLVEGWNVGWDGDWTADGRNFDFRKAYPDFDLEMLAQYAKDKGTKIIGHHETAGAAAHYESQLEEAFKLYQDNGIDAVKTGYVGAQLDNKEWHDGQYAVRHYRKVIETAASYGIMIDNHEPVKGTGLERTYPNYMS